MRMAEIFEGLGVSLDVLGRHAGEIARHEREVRRDAEQALSVPIERLTLRARRAIGQDEEMERHMLDIEAQRARSRYLRTKRQLVQQLKAEQDARRRFERLLARELGENE